jgi:ElaB/YqjD/DUF883 family membrane-anchored ribosome-binding protein
MSDTTLQDAKTGIAEKASEVTSQVKQKASDLGRTAAAKIDENREPAASGFESAARAIHQNAESLPGGEKVTDLAHSAADKLSDSADYVREHDVKSMMADVERLVKNNPGPSLLAAAVLGFLVGRTFSSND